MHKPDCTTRDVWVLLQARVTETLNSVTLSDLCREHGATFLTEALVGPLRGQHTEVAN